MLSAGPGELLLLGLLGGGLAVAVIAVVVGLQLAARTTALGRRLAPRTACPRCAREAPMVRRPKTLRQALWGGWTCEGCGLELDRVGRRVGPGA